ncbi:MAG: GNAT family N-acetyltransferase [Burkholderiales bacterium]|nr:GNAT family N-acetyltransferase [Burkholderiales bacterium]
MPDSFTVRPIARDDLAQWEALWGGYNSFYHRTLAAEITHMTWSRFFDAYEPVHALVAQSDDRLVGLVHYLFHRSTITIGPTCYLQDLFTAEHARGRGVGRALIEAVYARAKEAGASRVYWLTRDSNLTSIKLYDKIAQTSGLIVYRMPITGQ